MADIILHHYPASPVSEKVRVALGLKGLQWRSVEIPRLPPKPDLVPLTGGYRRTPVMQIGADIFCDSQCILRELERRFPEPTLYPGGAQGMVWGISRWTDGPLFDACLRLVLGANVDKLPKDFAEDRGRLYLGPGHDLQAVAADLPHVIAQIRGQFGWMDQRLADRPFMLGDAPGLPDVLAYYLVWFLRGRWKEGPRFLASFAALTAWETRMRKIGHGTPSEMSAKDALDAARQTRSATPQSYDPDDPQPLVPGRRISVVPEGDGGDPEVRGQMRFADRETVALIHANDRVGEVCVHFPRVGYRITT